MLLNGRRLLRHLRRYGGSCGGVVHDRLRVLHRRAADLAHPPLSHGLPRRHLTLRCESCCAHRPRYRCWGSWCHASIGLDLLSGHPGRCSRILCELTLQSLVVITRTRSSSSSHRRRLRRRYTVLLMYSLRNSIGLRISHLLVDLMLLRVRSAGL